jgi:hypothetical protein
METKTFVWIGMFLGSSIGGFISGLWGSGFLSLASIFWSGIGAIVGIWLGFRFSKMF